MFLQFQVTGRDIFEPLTELQSTKQSHEFCPIHVIVPMERSLRKGCWEMGCETFGTAKPSCFPDVKSWLRHDVYDILKQLQDIFRNIMSRALYQIPNSFALHNSEHCPSLWSIVNAKKFRKEKAFSDKASKFSLLTILRILHGKNLLRYSHLFLKIFLEDMTGLWKVCQEMLRAFSQVAMWAYLWFIYDSVNGSNSFVQITFLS